MPDTAPIHESDSTQQELLPCPKCGSPAIIERNHGVPPTFKIGCMRHRCISMRFSRPQRHLQIERWNTRVDLTAPTKPKSGGVNLFLTEVSHDRLMLLEHLARTTDMWLDAEDAYLKDQGENIPYTEEYASIVESRIFNNHALRSAIKNYRIQSQSKESSNDS